jgi:hypothetical protein
VQVAFALPPETDPRWILSLLGGALDGSASQIAVIDESGRVSYR